MQYYLPTSCKVFFNSSDEVMLATAILNIDRTRADKIDIDNTDTVPSVSQSVCTMRQH